jgi:hypothetical protein
MARLSIERNQKLSLKIMPRVESAKSYYLQLSNTKHRGGILADFCTECLLHLGVFARVAVELEGELAHWRSANEPSDGVSGQTMELGWGLATDRVEDLIELLKIDHTEEFLRIARIIMEKSITLSGFGIAKEIAEILASIREIAEAKGIPDADLRTTAKIIAKSEIFMMSGLIASQIALMQVRALTREPALQSLPLPLKEMSQQRHLEAREEIAARVLEARKLQEKRAPMSYLRFPREGLWPTRSETEN